MKIKNSLTVALLVAGGLLAIVDAARVVSQPTGQAPSPLAIALVRD